MSTIATAPTVTFADTLRALDASRPVELTGPDGDGPPAPAPVDADENRLRQVVANLVGNAVTHTPAGSPVRIGVGTVGGRAVLDVIDGARACRRSRPSASSTGSTGPTAPAGGPAAPARAWGCRSLAGPRARRRRRAADAARRRRPVPADAPAAPRAP